MADSIRQRVWRNENQLLQPTASQQLSVTLATQVLEKDCTAVRIILELGFQPTTFDVNSVLTYAIWFGATQGIPSDIEADNSESYLLWSAIETHRKTTLTDIPWVYRSYDLRAMRRARNDVDRVNFIVRADSAAAVNVHCASRVLCLLP